MTVCSGVGLVGLLGGCNDPISDDRPEKEGELGVGTFRYICVGDADPYCDEGFVASAFPDRFAIGGRFDLDFDPDDNFIGPDDPLPQVISGATDSVDSQSMAFVFLRPGFSVMLARDGEGQVIDLRHLYGSAVAEIAVFTMDSQQLAQLELGAGTDLDVQAEPRDETRSVLAGSLDYTWSIDDETIAEVLTTDRDREVTIRARTDGQTSLRITAGGFEQVIDVVVGEGVASATTTDSTSATDTGDASTSGVTTGATTSDDSATSTGVGEGGTGDDTGGSSTGGTGG